MSLGMTTEGEAEGGASYLVDAGLDPASRAAGSVRAALDARIKSA